MSLRHCGSRFLVACRWMVSLVVAVGACRVARAEQQTEASGAPLKGVVVAADGQPVAGAVVAFTGKWRQRQAPEAIETETDAAGKFVLTPPAVERLPGAYFGTVWAYSRGSGIAHLELTVPAKNDLQLKLPPGAETRIKVVDPDGAPAVGVQVFHTGLRIAMSRNGETVYGFGALPEPIAARTAVTTDPAGMAVLTAMTPDEISGIRCVSLEWGAQEVHRPHKAEAEPVVRLRRVGRVRGRVVCDDPNAVRRIKVRLTTTANNAEDHATSVSGEDIVATDDEGRFEAVLAGGRLSASASPPSDLPYLPVSPKRAELRASGDVEVSIELKRATTVRGVVQEKGGARLQSDALLVRNLSTRGGEWAFVQLELDRDGRFEFFHPVGEAIQIMTSMRSEGRSWVLFPVAPGKAAGPLDIPPLELLMAQGRIVDQAGRPTVGARIEQAWMRYEFDGKIHEQKLRNTRDAHLISADSSGRFEVQVLANHSYRLAVAADGMNPTLTDWVDFSRPEINAFPEIVLSNSHTLSGRVLDQQGRPIPGATVFQSGSKSKPAEVTTDQRGEYRLMGLSAGAGFVFARHPNYRFHGRVVGAGVGQLDINLTRPNESPRPAVQVRLDVMKPDEQLDLARQLMQPWLSQALASDNDGAKRRALETWALVDPHDCLMRLAQTTLADREEADAVRIAVAKALVAEEPEKAIALLQAVESRLHRVFGAIELVKAAPGAARELKLQVLAANLPAAESIEEPPTRVMSMSLIAHKLTELGDRQRAEPIARQQAQQALKIGYDPNDSCGALIHVAAAVALAPYDLEAALQLAPEHQAGAEAEDDEDLNEERAEIRRYLLGSIARAIAASNPAESERIIELFQEAAERANAVVALCPKLAIADLPRARRLAATIADLRERAHAEGELAKAFARNDPAAGAECLSEAFRLLVTAADDPKAARIEDAEFAASLLPIAEQVAPERLDEFFWQTISLAHFDQQLALDGVYQVQMASGIAAFVARYDLQAARLLLGAPEITLGALGGNSNSSRLRGYRAFFAALASIDAKEAVALLNRLPDQASGPADGESPKEAARQAVVQILVSQGESRLRTLSTLVGIPDYGADDF